MIGGREPPGLHEPLGYASVNPSLYPDVSALMFDFD